MEAERWREEEKFSTLRQSWVQHIVSWVAFLSFSGSPFPRQIPQLGIVLVKGTHVLFHFANEHNFGVWIKPIVLAAILSGALDS